MDPSELKQAWQSQLSGRRLLVNEDVILRQVVRGQRDLRAMVFWRDLREIGAALLLAGFFFYVYLGLDRAWPWLLVAASMVWIAGFLFVVRIRHRGRHPHKEDSIQGCVQSTLAEIKHQIWLLESVLWWYILPPLAAMEVHVAYVALLLKAPLAFFKPQPVLLGIMLGIYLLNRWAVKSELEPRRQETEALLQSLEAPGKTAP